MVSTAKKSTVSSQVGFSTILLSYLTCTNTSNGSQFFKSNRRPVSDYFFELTFLNNAGRESEKLKFPLGEPG